jgi:hypothetical protein
MSYQYTITANDCRLGTASTPVQYPSPCASSPTIVQQGASNGSTASGTSPSDPWIFNAGDTITVTAAAGATIQTVSFDRFVYPSGSAVGLTATIPLPGPYVYTWADTGVSGQIYSVRITVTYVGGCKETHVRYVEQFVPAACSFANQTPSFNAATNTRKAGGNAFVNQDFTITNSGQDSMRLQTATVNSTTFTHNVTIVWFDPNRASGVNPHDDLELIEIDYSLPSGTTIKDQFSGGQIGSSAATMTNSRPIPNTVTDLANNASLAIRFIWQYKKNQADFLGTPIQKICLSYHLFIGSAVDPNDTAQKFCNLVGQNQAGTNNPTSCD